MKPVLTCLFMAGALIGTLSGQAPSPPASTSVTINGKKLDINYSAPSRRNRDIFGKGGVISNDGSYPVWRMGANAATSLKTEADLTIGTLSVPKGSYTLYIDTAANPWQLIVSKQTGQDGSEYNKPQDLGRTPMRISKPPATIETMKITLSSPGANRGLLRMEWENVVAQADITVK